jgi:hypothetical protein
MMCEPRFCVAAIISLESREHEKSVQNKKEHVKPDQVVRLGVGGLMASPGCDRAKRRGSG